LFNLKKDIFLYFAYITLQSSPFLLKENINIIESIEHDIVNKYSSKGDIILCGDLKARLGKENDYIPLDSVSHIPIYNECYDIDIAVNDRNSQDTLVDARGRDIIDICIGNKLRILNGGTLGDSKGKYTCYKPVGCSVIYYFIVSESLMSQILYMTVSDFITDFSDCHCKLSLKLLASFERKKVTQNLRDMPCRYIWTEQSHIAFQTHSSNNL
jgi:hypothetical protein